MWSIAIWIIKNIQTMLNLQADNIINRINIGTDIQIVENQLPQTPEDGIYFIYQNVDLT